MNEVSSLYRLSPSDGYISKEEAAFRLKAKLRRLIAQHGKEETIRKILASSVDDDVKARLVDVAESIREGQATGSI